MKGLEHLTNEDKENIRQWWIHNHALFGLTVDDDAIIVAKFLMAEVKPELEKLQKENQDFREALESLSGEDYPFHWAKEALTKHPETNKDN